MAAAKDKPATKPAANKTNKPFWVRATALGYFDESRKSEGSIFQVTPDQFSENWMEKLTAAEAKQLLGASSDEGEDS